jgi:dTDP-4-dehydrorhamnose reductase
MKKILVTGANGQLGNEIRKLSLVKNRLKYIFTDVEDLDITDRTMTESFVGSEKMDFLINCAAYTDVDKAESETDSAFLINSTALANLAAVSRKYKIPVIHVSTDYVFDGKNSSPYNEDDITGPLTVYGKSKLEGEKQLKDSHSSIILRTSWLYSSFGHNFVKTMLRLANERDELKVVNDQIGSPTYAEDLANVITELTELYFAFPEKFVPGIFHYSNEGSCSWYEFAKEIMKISGSQCLITPVTSLQYLTAAKRPAFSLLDKTKIKDTYGLEVPDWKDSLKSCLNLLN